MSERLPVSIPTNPRIDTLPESNFASQPAASQQTQFKALQPYLIGGLIVALVLFLGYQQMQISQLTSELSLVSNNVKSSDVKTRLESQEHSLGELNSRLAYLDSKINATDQKAQQALSRVKSVEENDIVVNLVKGFKQTFGIK